MSDALEATAGSFGGKDPSQSSPMSDRKKNRRKKSMNQKGDAAVGQAEGNIIIPQGATTDANSLSLIRNWVFYLLYKYRNNFTQNNN